MSGVILYIIILCISVAVAARIGGGTDGNRLLLPSAAVMRDKICLTALFFILFIPSALRIHTGNDYLTYIVRFHDAYTGNHIVTEPGFNLIVNAVYRFMGQEVFLLVFAVFAFLTVAVFLRAIYTQSRDMAMTVFLFLALGLYFQTYNTVRYYLALGILLGSMRYAVKKEYIKFAAAVLIAAMFHKTAVCVLIFYPFCTFRWNRILAVLMAAGGVSGLMFKQQYLALFLRIYPSYVNEDEYLASGSISWVNLLRCVLTLALCAYVYKEHIREDDTLKFYMKLNILALIFYGCFSFVPFASRIGYYLNISQILLIPGCCAHLPEKKKKYLKLIVFVCGTVYFAFFLYKAFGNTVKVLPYSTWLDYAGSFDGLSYVKVTG